MPEKVLPLALSGLEVRKAILDKVDQRLEKDGYLNPNLAYDYFRADISLKVECHDVGRVVEVKLQETVAQGEPPEEEGQFLKQSEGDFAIEPKPPNELRVETGQEVPVLTKDEKGKLAIKGIRYGRDKAKAVK